MTVIFVFGDFLFIFLINSLHRLSAFSVTEHVLIIKLSGLLFRVVLLYPFFPNILDIDEVSEKLSLQPKV